MPRTKDSSCEGLLIIVLLIIVFWVTIIGVFSNNPSKISSTKNTGEISLNEYKEVKKVLTETPEASKIYAKDGIQRDEYNIIIKNGVRIQTENVKNDIIKLIGE